MTTRASRYALDRARLGLSPESALGADDRARLERVEIEQRAFGLPPRRRTRTPATASLLRGILRGLRSLTWVLGPVAALLVLTLDSMTESLVVSPRGERAKGSSRVELFVRRGEATFGFDGQALRPEDTLIFRYSSTRTHLVLAGQEDGRPVQVYVKVPIEPGQARVAETGVRLDDYAGGEWFYAVLAEDEVSSERVQSIIAADSGPSTPGVEVFRWRIEREAP